MCILGPVREGRDPVRLRLFPKLLIGFAGVALTALLVAATLWRWQFTAGFLDYMNRSEQAQVERVADLLAERLEVGAAAHIGQLRERDWNRLWRLGRPDDGPAGRPGRRGDRPAPRDRPPRPPGGPMAPTAPAAPLPPRDRDGPLAIERRVALFDAEGARVAGPQLPEGLTQDTPVLVEGRPMGTLRRVVLTEIGAGPEQVFLREQARLTAISLIILALFTTLAAWWFARRLSAPVREVARGTRRLADGRLDTRLNLQRSDEIGDLARDFDDLAERLTAAEKSRRRWMADIAHELRTPLTVLRGEIEALVDGVRKPEPERLKSLEAEISCLSRLVEDLRTLALSDRGALDYRMGDVDLAALLKPTLETFRDQARDQELSFSADLSAPCMVHGDADRLLQLCNNLLSNALRHTHAQGRVEVRLASKGGATLIVRDSAPSVPDEDLDKLGTPLFRVDEARTRDGGGSGLGLAIARRIAESHRAQMTFAASPLGGLEVRVRFPEAA